MNNDNIYSSLLSDVFALEGLLLVAERHGRQTPAEVYQRIEALGAEIARNAQTFASRQAPAIADPQGLAQPTESGCSDEEPIDDFGHSFTAEATAPSCDSDDTTDGETLPKLQATDEDRLPEKDYDADETWQHDNGEEFTEVFRIDYVEPEESQAQPADTMPTAEKEMDDDSLRVDEKLQRTLSKDMRKALSVNDRFRFKRELFSNSDADLNNALDLVNAMQDYDEAADYFLGHLGWDRDNTDVADFMGLVRRHFLQPAH